MTWRREDVGLGDVFTRDDVTGDPDAETPLLYRVLSIADSPTVQLVPLYERDGEDTEHYVISSPLFAEFRKVVTIEAGGQP